MTMNEYFGDWMKVIDERELTKINDYLKTLDYSRICPSPKDIFKAFNLCPLSNLKVIILGQTPYCTLYKGKPKASGIAFANKNDISPKDYSSSLKVLRESVIDYTIPHKAINFEPSLESWEKQGVLLLNTSLTCCVGKPNSHSMRWKPFIRSLLKNLSLSTTGIVYILMGDSAKSFKPYICSISNLILETNNPSWFIKNRQNMPSDIWRETNDFLINHYTKSIQWYTEY